MPSFGEDFAKNPGLPLRKLESFLDDIQAQPQWRSEADRACEYYDGNQIDAETRAAMEERGQPVLIHNLTAASIDGVLGMEARTRTDWVVKADDDESVEVAEALNEKINEASRMASADRATSDAYAAEVKCGLGWVEVSKNPDPFAYRYRINTIHRREIFWDWHSKRPDLQDARWLLRRRWLDEDEALMAFPAHRDLIRYASRGWDAFDAELALNDSPLLVGAYTDYSDTRLNLDDWYDSERARVLVYEVYYRVFSKKPVMSLPDGRVLEIDKNNKMHMALVASGQVDVTVAPFPKMRLAYFIGPHRLVDVPSPNPHNHFPYVPFWGFREDNSSVPYGLIRRMMPAQDEINHRRSKLTYLLNSKLVIKDDDALMSMSEEQMMDELYRADGVITLNPNRKNKDHNAFRVEVENGIASQQFQIMQEAQKIIQDTAGIYAAFLGQEGGAKSGVAINSLVEQGSTTLAELNDNYRFGRRQVGELLLANIIDDMSKKKNIQVRTNIDKPKPSKTIILNGTADNERFVTNDVMRAKLHVTLADISSTPGYRAQVAERLMNMVGQLPPEMQVAVLDIVLEATDIPNRNELIKRVRQVTGQGVDPSEMTEEQLAQMEQQQKEQSIQKEMQLQEAVKKLEKLDAETRRINAEAASKEGSTQLIPLDAEKRSAETQKIIADIKNIIADVAGKRRQLVRDVVEPRQVM